MLVQFARRRNFQSVYKSVPIQQCEELKYLHICRCNPSLKRQQWLGYFMCWPHIIPKSVWRIFTPVWEHVNVILTVSWQTLALNVLLCHCGYVIYSIFVKIFVYQISFLNPEYLAYCKFNRIQHWTEKFIINSVVIFLDYLSDFCKKNINKFVSYVKKR